MMRYLSGTREWGIRFSPTGNEVLDTYADASWKRRELKMKSQSGAVMMLAGGPIIWFSRKQKRVAPSTQVAEYIATNEIGRDGLWITNLYEELGLPVRRPFHIWCDNQAAIRATENGLNSRGNRFLDLDEEFLVEECQSGRITIDYIESEKNTADVFTKLLPRNLFEKHREKLECDSQKEH